MAGLAAFALACAAAGTASAADQFTIDAHAASFGPIVTDSAGNGYVAWEHANGSGADIPMFCKLAPGAKRCRQPVALGLPGGTSDDYNSALAPFPILGPGDVVWVVTSRYDADDIVIWTSTNGGQTFSAPHDIPSGTICTGGGFPCRDGAPYTDLEGLDDTLAVTNQGDTYDRESYIDGVGQAETPFIQSSSDPGLGFGFAATDVQYIFGPLGVAVFTFGAAGPYVDIEASALGTTTTGDIVEAYTSDAAAVDAVDYFFYTPSAAYPYVFGTGEASWQGPVTLADHYAPRLADGRSGLFMIAGSEPPGKRSAIDVFHWSAATHSFGAAHRIAPLSISGSNGGLGENYDTGELAGVWPTETASGAERMDLFLSTDGGASFSPGQEIATVGNSYGGFGTARVAIADTGTGFVTFQDARGLEVADLEPLPTQFTGLHVTGRSLGVPVTCSAPKHACTVALTLKAKHAGRTQTFHLDSGVTHVLKLRLSPALLSVLKSRHTRVRAKLTLKISSPGARVYRLILHPVL
jgi:hypothetical protein